MTGGWRRNVLLALVGGVVLGLVLLAAFLVGDGGPVSVFLAGVVGWGVGYLVGFESDRPPTDKAGLPIDQGAS